MSKSYTVIFGKKEKVAKDAYTFYFKRGKFPDFIPGQYLRLEIPHKADDRGTTRYFTISSSPLNKKYLTITTKINRHSGDERSEDSRIAKVSAERDSGQARMTEMRSSFKHTLFNLKPGTKVNVFGPIGWFVLPKDEKEEKVFIAGGIGVTPFHSLLHTLVDEKLMQPITLFVIFSTKEDAVFYDALTSIAKKNPQIQVVYLFRNSQENQNSLSGESMEKYVNDLKKVVFYIVGSEKMVAEKKKLLLDLGINEEKIQTEDFTGYR